MREVNVVNLTKEPAPLKSLKIVALATMKYLSLSGELSLVLTTDHRLKTLNRDYRGHNKTTDILTFPAPKTTANFLGEIFINLKYCSRVNQYKEVFDFKPSRDYLLFFLLVHGLLHLAAYSDEEEEGRLEMVALGKKIMTRLIKEKIIKATE